MWCNEINKIETYCNIDREVSYNSDGLDSYSSSRCTVRTLIVLTENFCGVSYLLQANPVGTVLN